MNDSNKFSDQFERSEGRRPRVLLVALGGIDAKINRHELASHFADAGFDVDLTATIQSTQQIHDQALENDVHLVVLVHFYSDLSFQIKTKLSSISQKLPEIEFLTLDRFLSKENELVLIFETNSDYKPDALVDWLLGDNEE